MLPEETLRRLSPKQGGRYIDGTLGGGGHAALLLEATAPDGQVLGIDADEAALRRVRDRLAESVADGRLLTRQGNFARMGELARAASFAPVDGVLLDLGLSSDQLAARDRGFSFATDAPLDMRFDTSSGQPASDLLNTLDERELADLFWHNGEERHSRAIARRIVKQRQTAPIQRTGELASLVASVVHGRPGGIHPATRVFQALRIAVNDELVSLAMALPQALELLRPGGRLAVISFHSLEDRIVKQFFQLKARGCVCPPELPVCVCGRKPQMKIITRHPVTASGDELARNSRSRSAKLRVAERLPEEPEEP